jgi:hypothetical protein
MCPTRTANLERSINKASLHSARPYFKNHFILQDGSVKSAFTKILFMCNGVSFFQASALLNSIAATSCLRSSCRQADS